jgi:hypothetical protein
MGWTNVQSNDGVFGIFLCPNPHHHKERRAKKKGHYSHQKLLNIA